MIMMMDDDTRKKKQVHEVGMVLDSLSIDELETRITVLEEEIARLKQAISDKTRSRSAADSVFKF